MRLNRLRGAGVGPPMRDLRAPSSIATALTALSLFFASPDRAAALDEGTRMPEIGLTDLTTGKRIDRASLEGKVVIVDFWATWCAPCKQELPQLEALYEKYKARGLVVIAISVDTDAAKAKALASQLKLSFPIAHDAQHVAAERFDPPRMPSSFIVDRKGLVRHVHSGFRAGDEAAIERELIALLGPSVSGKSAAGKP